MQEMGGKKCARRIKSLGKWTKENPAYNAGVMDKGIKIIAVTSAFLLKILQI